MKNTVYLILISLFMTTSVNSMDYSKIIIGKWKDQSNEPLFEFFKDGKMTFMVSVFSSVERKNHKYQIVGNELRYEELENPKNKGIFIIEKYENGILYMYLKENGKEAMGQLTRIKEK